MLKDWQSHQEYKYLLHEAKVRSDSSFRNRLHDLRAVLAKLSALDLDPVFEYLKPLYSDIGRPAVNQVQILRSFILFCLLRSMGRIHCGMTTWVNSILPNDPVYLALAGVFRSGPPPLGSYFDFMNRLWLVKDRSRYSRNCLFADYKNRKKPEKPGGKGQKAKDHPGVVGKLVPHLMDGGNVANPEAVLQKVLFLSAVLPSQELGLIPSSGLTVSGDGTAVHTHSSPFGHSPEQEAAVDTPFVPRHYSDPDASCGWDSDIDDYYFGYSLYHISTYNAEAKVDLPIICRFTHAKRHDSVSGVITLHQLHKNFPEVRMSNVCLDSAHDNYQTYDMLESWGVTPFIDLNTHGKSLGDPVSGLMLDKDGSPLCPGGERMTYYGYDRTKRSFKWRCPFATGKIGRCSYKCMNPSDYGMTVYTKPGTDKRLYPPVPRGTEAWDEVYKKRTCSERINNRILNNYGLHSIRIHGFDHYSFMTMAICICIHLDAWYKTGKIARIQ